VRNMNPEKAEGLSPELQAALEPLLNAIESLSERIVEYNERIENLAQQSYPQVALLKQIKGVGTLIALTYMLTLEDPHRFRKSRESRAIVATARKLAVLLHHLWVSGEVYEPLHNSSRTTVAAAA